MDMDMVNAGLICIQSVCNPTLHVIYPGGGSDMPK